MKHPFSSVHQIAGNLANKVDDWKQEKQQQLAKSAQETSKNLSTLSTTSSAASAKKSDAPQDN